MAPNGRILKALGRGIARKLSEKDSTAKQMVSRKDKLGANPLGENSSHSG